MTMEKISEAILEKVKAEAEQIVKEAEERAKERIENARNQQQTRFDEEKAKLLNEANSEAARIAAQASISIRLETLKTKNEVIDEIVSRVKQNLSEHKVTPEVLKDLISEGVNAVDTEKVVVYVSKSDIETANDAIKYKDIAAKVKDVRETDCIGGVIIEDADGKISIDNTYDTRLETLLPRVMPEISRELFGS